MNNLLKKVVSLVLVVLMALSCIVFASAAGVVYGDVNSDTKINSSDALLVLQHSVQSIRLEGDQFTAADVNADEKINAGDALSILQYAVGTINKFPAEDVTDGGDDNEGEEGGAAIPAPKTAAEILAFYTKTVNDARAEIPAYRLRTKSEVTDVDVSGSAFLLSPPSEVKKYEDSLRQKSEYSNLLRADSQTALQNLPAVCNITDASKFKSITCTVLADGNYQIDIVFKDEKDPKAGSPIVTMMSLPDKATLEKTMQDEIDDAVTSDPELNDIFNEGSDLSGLVNMKITSLQYMNCSVSCVIDSQTGEFVSYKSDSDTKMVLKTVMLGTADMITDSTTHSLVEYSNFVY